MKSFFKFGLPVVFFFMTLAAAVPAHVVAQKISFVADPADAKIYLVNTNGSLTLIGTGRATYRLRRKNTNSIEVQAEGFESKQWHFVRRQKYSSPMTLALDTRVVSVVASNENALIYAGDIRIGVGTADVSVSPNQTVTVEARLDGYWPARTQYSRTDGSGVLPLTDVLNITDRMIVVSARPPNSSIWVDAQFAGENFVEVRLPENSCVTVGATADGFVGKEEVYCNQEHMEAPPKAKTIFLTDREVTVRVIPRTGSILVDGRVVGTDEYSVIVPEEKCVEVGVEQDGYVGQTRRYCNQTGRTAPPELDLVELNVDEAFSGSEASDQANNNITIEVGGQRSFDDAWKIMSLIVLSAFDILEITDKETGYLRTAWTISRFESSTTRTRVIVKQGSISPVKFVVKIVSEFSSERDTSPSCDMCFRPWDRLLYQYRDMINEMIFRLR